MVLHPKENRKQTLGEEIANSISHGAGFIGAVMAAPFLIFYAAQHGDAWTVAGVSVFISTAMALYLSSAVYHAVKAAPVKKLFRIIDHAAIFLLIAGTYTPFTLGILRGVWGWTLFGLIWSIALAGIIFKVVVGARYPKISTALYLLMGWLAVIAVKPFWEAIPVEGLLWIAAGGLAYTLGVIFYALPQLRYAHFIWHLFVLAGTASHFIAVMYYSY
ncbi:MAG: hemolysin III family protein [Balneolaceae bacterium]